tara:strand:- start:1615 stop:2964 length:1350 start_codon:yes stop_codon:yes gene_type:complete
MVNLLDPEELFLFLENYETDFIEKKQRGVVFTNLKIVEEVMKKLPKEVWFNPSLKWLDPCCGIGNFSIYLYFELMKTLKNKIKNEEKRRKHILENMIYMVEMNETYCKITQKIFLSDKYKINLFCGSYVSLHTLNKNIQIFNSSDKYDIIFGNPPYQKENKIDTTKLSAKPLYPFFVEKSIELLNMNGYLNFIHPVSWRRKSKEIKILKLLTQYHFLYLYTSNCFKAFRNCAPYINIYVLQKKYNHSFQTHYETEFDSHKYTGRLIIPNNLEFMPFLLNNESFSIIYKMIHSDGFKLKIQLESKFSTSKKNIRIQPDKKYKYKNLHTNHKKKGLIYRYSEKKHPCHDKIKIIMNFKGGYQNFRPIIDLGTCGITDNSMYMEVSDQNKEFIFHFLNSKIIYFLLKITNYNFGTNHKNEFHILNLITIPNNNEYNKFYKFTKKESDFINKI